MHTMFRVFALVQKRGVLPSQKPVANEDVSAGRFATFVALRILKEEGATYSVVRSSQSY